MVKLLPTSTYTTRDKDGKEHMIAQLYSDTYSELLNVSEVNNVILDSGSIALTADGELCVFDSQGIWHKKDGTAIS